MISKELFVLLRLPDHVMRYLSDRYDEIFKQLVLVPGREQWRADGQLVEDATYTPHIDCVIVLYSEDNLGSAVVSALYIEEAARAILATRAKVNQLHLVELFVGEQDILRLHVAVDYPFVFHEFQALANLLGYDLELLGVEGLFGTLVHLLVFVEVETEAVEDNDDVLPEPEVVDHVHKAVVPFVVAFVRLHQFLKEPDLDIRIINVKLFVLADLRSNYTLVRVLVINTFDDLTEGAFIDGSYHFVAVADLFSLLY